MKVAVIGANGQLGGDLRSAFAAAGDEVLPLGHAAIEISSADSVRAALGPFTPELVINTAALHHVERCENDPEAAFAVNAIGPRNLALYAAGAACALLHFSTDYVFDGRQHVPYTEDALPGPLNVYGTSKLSGEYFVRSIAPRYFVLRVSALYGRHPCRGKGGLNFVELMLKLGTERPEVRVVDDEFVSPTSTAAVARQAVTLSRTASYGLYHATAEGSCSWFEFAQEIFAAARLPAQLLPARPGEFPAKVRRPSYSVLENAALKRLGLNTFSGWRDGVREYVAAREAAAAFAPVGASPG